MHRETVYYFDPAIQSQLDRIEWKLDRNWGKIHRGEMKMSAEFEALEVEVARNRTVDQSILALVKGLADRIAAAGVDPAKLKALTEDLRGSSDDIVAAVLAHTPVQPAPPVEPLPPAEVEVPADPTLTG